MRYMNEDEVEEAAMTTYTVMDSVRQWALVYGADHPDRAWLLHDRDVWVPNPCYRGAPVPHPEMED
jgi:hypothetical protein